MGEIPRKLPGFGTKKEDAAAKTNKVKIIWNGEKVTVNVPIEKYRAAKQPN